MNFFFFFHAGCMGFTSQSSYGPADTLTQGVFVTCNFVNKDPIHPFLFHLLLVSVVRPKKRWVPQREYDKIKCDVSPSGVGSIVGDPCYVTGDVE